MKKNFLKNKLYAYVLFHLGIAVFFAAVLMMHGKSVGIDSNLFSMMPKSSENEVLAFVDESLTKKSSRNALILSAGKNFEDAKSAASKVYDALKSSPNFSSVDFYADSESFADLKKFLFEKRYFLLPEKYRKMTETPEGMEKMSSIALEKAYSPFTFSSLENLSEDPFLLQELILSDYIGMLSSSGTSLSLKDGVLAAQKDGMWYVMVRCLLSESGSSIVKKQNGITEIYDVCLPLEKEGCSFVFSGTPFHSQKSSSQASFEITILSFFSMLAVLAILFFVFRSVKPILLSFMAICISISISLLLCFAFFKKVHVLSFVFGTTLIGSCIDYSIHFFTSGKMSKSLFKSLTLSLVSTEICFLMLFFTPFAVLHQISLFSMTGILSSYLTVVCLFPKIASDCMSLKIHSFDFSIFFSRLMQKFNEMKFGHFKNIFLAAIVCVFIPVVVLKHDDVKIRNNLSNLYKMTGRLFEDEKKTSEVLEFIPSGWFVVSGNSQDELLSNEENLCRKLGNAFSISRFVPSLKTQAESKKSCERLLKLAGNQLCLLGFDEKLSASVEDGFRKSKDDFVMLEDIPSSLKKLLSENYIGEHDGKFYSVVMPSGFKFSEKNDDFLSSCPGVIFVNKAKDLEKSLDVLTKIILKMFLVSYVIVYIILRFQFSRKKSLKIVSVPFFVILSVAFVFALSGISLEFFSVTGLVLVLGLGLDYIIHMSENGSGHFAVFLSFLTTAISFGSIAFSSFVPVRMIGLSVFIGLCASYVFSVVLAERN